MPQELLFDVYFLDYGDKQFVTKRNILELRADFLSLRFQAVECFLAHVQPTNGGSKIDEWDEKAVSKFEELVKPSHWKKLISKVVAYKERKDFVIKQRSKQRESSPVPGVELYDPDESEEKSIALELVKMGYADLNDDQFGDLRKSSILRQNKDDEDTSKSQVKDDIEDYEVVVETSNVDISKDEDKVQVPSENKEQTNEVPINENQNEPDLDIVDETNNNSIKDTNGEKKVFNDERQDQEENAFKKPGKPEKKVKTTKKKKNEKLADFLTNEQKTTTKSVAKSAVDDDWNEMLEDSS
jgi:tudor domain-containing protein 2